MSYDPTRLHFERTGAGPAVILVHGNPAAHSLWRPVVEPLARHHTVYAIDLPGFGQSPPPKDRSDLSLQNLGRLVLEFAKSHGIESFDLVGHSFGGAISLTAAAIDSSHIRHLVAITPMGDIPPPAGKLVRTRVVRGLASGLWRIAPAMLRRAVAKAGNKVSYGSAYTHERALEVAREMNRPHIAATAIGLISQCDYEAYGRALEEVEKKPSLPVMLIGAGADRVVPFEHFERVRARLPRAHIELFPEGSHVPMWQYPEKVVEMVEGFLSSEVRGSSSNEAGINM